MHGITAPGHYVDQHGTLAAVSTPPYLGKDSAEAILQARAEVPLQAPGEEALSPKKNACSAEEAHRRAEGTAEEALRHAPQDTTATSTATRRDEQGAGRGSPQPTASATCRGSPQANTLNERTGRGARRPYSPQEAPRAGT